VLATVMSRPPHAAIVDAGLKASNVDSGLPGVWQRPGLAYTHASDETFACQELSLPIGIQYVLECRH
jgi:Putative serine dehydratase domain